MPKNESYAIRMIELVATYFVVSKKYAFLIIVHMNAACSIGLIVLIATGTIVLSTLNYICAAFEIAGWRNDFLNPIMNDKYSDYQKYFVFLFEQSIWQNLFNYSRNIIYSYRIKQAMAINLAPTFYMKNDIVIQKKMIRAIRIHRKAIELVLILWYLYYE